MARDDRNGLKLSIGEISPLLLGVVSVIACFQQCRLLRYMDFEFVDPGILKGDDFELFRFSIMPPDISRGLVPAYDFRIRIKNQIAGQVNLRVGLTEHIMLYAGNLGYKVDSPYRGRHLAARAINLLLPVARNHQMSELWICCNPENWASRKTCERLGAELVEIIEVPPGVDLYDRGDRANCRYRLRL